MKDLKQDAFNTILKIAEEHSGVPVPKHVDFNTRIRETYFDMQMDSLDEIEIIMKLEKHYGISFRDDDLKAYTDKTFGEFCDFVCSYINIPQRQQVSLLKKIKQHFQRTK